MAQYDGKIKIDTEISTKTAESQLLSLENRIRKIAEKMSKLTSELNSMSPSSTPKTNYSDSKTEVSDINSELEKTQNAQSKIISDQKNISDGLLELKNKVDAIAESGKNVKLFSETDEYKELKKQIEDYKDEINKLSSKYVELSKNQQEFGNSSSNAFDAVSDSSKNTSSQMLALENKISKVTSKISELKNKMSTLGTTKIPTQEYQDIQTQITKASVAFDNLLAKQEEMQAKGQTSGSAWDGLQYKLEEAGNTIRYAKGELDDLVAKGQAFRLGAGTEEYTKLNSQLSQYKGDMNVLIQKHEELATKQNQTGKTGEKAFNKVSNATKKTGGLLKTIATRFKGIALSLLIFNWITKGFNAMIEGLKSGINNYVQYSSKLNKTFSDFSTASATFKNALGAAFAPILNMVVPALTTLINYLITAINYFNQFVALLSGKTTWSKATTQQKDYAKSLGGTASAAKKATNALASFDEAEVLSKNDTSDSGSGGGAGAGGMFEEVAVSDSLISKLKAMKEALQPIIDKIKELIDLFKQGFAAGLGDSFLDRIQNIKDNLASIGDSLIEIFTDPEVVASADDMANKIAYAFGQVVGSLASIGITIAQNLIGGIAKYLESSKDFIKERLVGLFDVTGDIAEIVGNFFEAFAYVFEAFGSENGQRVTASLIGIFVDAFLGLTEIVGGLARDILNVITQPFIDNKEALQSTLEDTLGVLATVLESIKSVVDNTVSQLVATYNQSFKPFFDSLASGFSSIFSILLDAYNQYLLPVLQDIAVKFSELMVIIQPYLDNFIILIGKVMEVIMTLWESAILPFLEWLVPMFVQAVSTIFDVFSTILFPVLQFFGELIGTIIKTAIGVLDGLITFIKGVFSGNWKQAWEGISKIVTSIWEGIKDVIKTVINGIIKNVNDMVSAVVAGMNAVISAINTIKVSIPEWVPGYGGKTFGLSLPAITAPKIPYLADGDVIKGGNPFLAMLGDQPAGQTNIETPLQTMLEAFTSALDARSNTATSGSLMANLYIDSNKVAEATIESFLNVANRMDISLLPVGG